MPLKEFDNLVVSFPWKFSTSSKYFKMAWGIFKLFYRFMPLKKFDNLVVSFSWKFSSSGI